MLLLLGGSGGAAGTPLADGCDDVLGRLDCVWDCDCSYDGGGSSALSRCEEPAPCHDDDAACPEVKASAGAASSVYFALGASPVWPWGCPWGWPCAGPCGAGSGGAGCPRFRGW